LSPEALLAWIPLGSPWKFNPPLLPLLSFIRRCARRRSFFILTLFACFGTELPLHLPLQGFRQQSMRELDIAHELS
jgi:hypothetical protein